nr:hypothetical protein [Microtetraspora sp. AC03309]
MTTEALVPLTNVLGPGLDVVKVRLAAGGSGTICGVAWRGVAWRGDGGGGRVGRSEPFWRPVTDVNMMTAVVLEQLGVNREQLRTLEPARRSPHLLDDHTAERIKQVVGEQRDDMWLWDETGEHWQAQDLEISASINPWNTPALAQPLTRVDRGPRPVPFRHVTPAGSGAKPPPDPIELITHPPWQRPGSRHRQMRLDQRPLGIGHIEARHIRVLPAHPRPSQDLNPK